VCAISCVGDSACAGNTEIRADDATDEMAVLCEGKDACKGNTIIDCGSVASCSLYCADTTSCEDATVDATKAGSFECTGYCDVLEEIKKSRTSRLRLSSQSRMNSVAGIGETEDKDQKDALQLQGNANGTVFVTEVMGDDGCDGNQTEIEGQGNVGAMNANNPYTIEVSLSRTELVSLWIMAMLIVASTTACCCWRFAKRGQGQGQGAVARFPSE